MLKNVKYLGLMLLVVLLAFFTACEKGKTALPKSSSKIAGILPASSKVMLKFSSMDEFYTLFNVQEKSILGNPVNEINEVVTKIGFNPLDIKQINQLGLDTKGEFGFVLDELNFDEQEVNELPGAVFFPVKDEKVVEAKMKELYSKMDVTVNGEKVNFTVTQENGISSVNSGDNDGKVFWTYKENYLFMTFGVDKSDYLTKLLKGEGQKLKDAPNFKNTLKNVSLANSFYAYVDMENIFNQKNLSMLQNLSQQPVQHNMEKLLDVYKAYNGLAFAMDLKKSDLEANWVLDIKKDSELKKMFNNNINRNVLHKMQKNPLLLLTFALNAAEYYKFIKEYFLADQTAQLDQQFAMVKQQFGIDIEKDIIENLGGNFGFGIYDGASINMMNYNSLLSFDLKDPARFSTALANLLKLVPPSQKQMMTESNIGGVQTYVFNQGMVQIHAGVAGNDFVVALGKPLYEEAIAKKGDALKNLDGKLQKDMNNSFSYFYLDFTELMKVYNTFAGMIQAFAKDTVPPQVIEKADNFEYIYADSHFEDNATFGRFVIKTKFKEPFFTAVTKLVEQNKQK
jgi:hypothetical protein